MASRRRTRWSIACVPSPVGDFTNVDVDGDYALVYVVASTLYGLLTQAAQVSCVRNAAARLAQGGVFVFEGFVPDPSRFAAQRAEVDPVSRHDPVQQRVASQRVVASSRGTQDLSVEVRYIWPSELDLMAQLAGLQLRERWGDWHRGPYTGSGCHIAIYERPPVARSR